MKSAVNKLITALLILVVALTPFIVLPYFTDYYEIPKLLFLFTLTFLLVILWAFSWVLEGKVLITRTPLDIPLLSILAVLIVSSAFSSLKFVGFVADIPRVHGSTASWL